MALLWIQFILFGTSFYYVEGCITINLSDRAGRTELVPPETYERFASYCWEVRVPAGLRAVVSARPLSTQWLSDHTYEAECPHNTLLIQCAHSGEEVEYDCGGHVATSRQIAADFHLNFLQSERDNFALSITTYELDSEDGSNLSCDDMSETPDSSDSEDSEDSGHPLSILYSPVVLVPTALVILLLAATLVVVFCCARKCQKPNTCSTHRSVTSHVMSAPSHRVLPSLPEAGYNETGYGSLEVPSTTLPAPLPTPRAPAHAATPSAPCVPSLGTPPSTPNLYDAPPSYETAVKSPPVYLELLQSQQQTYQPPEISKTN